MMVIDFCFATDTRVQAGIHRRVEGGPHLLTNKLLMIIWNVLITDND
jgi:hypothetical protein